MVESSRIPSFLLSARAVQIQILAQFNMTNHPHRLPDSSTLPARLIHWAGRYEQGVGVGWWQEREGNRDVERKKMEVGKCKRQALQEFMICATIRTNANVTIPCNTRSLHSVLSQVAFVI